jgi:bifunctional enzyme CysN/CysC
MNNVTKFLTCGSVDDGKSTMIGKLLFDAGLIFEDQLQSLRLELEKNGKDINALDYSFLLDGLLSEREQGITIDVAYRYFTMGDKKYIVADTPGHTQYTKNMATGASHCDAGIILIDARKGLGLQTRRHTLICALMGIKIVMFAVNKFDLMNWDENIYRSIEEDCLQLMRDLSEIGMSDISYSCTPISALFGDNLLNRSENMPWYNGLTAYEWLDNLELESVSGSSSSRFAVQYVIKSFNEENSYQLSAMDSLTDNEMRKFRSYSGKLISGNMSLGQRVKVSSSDIKTTVKGIIKGFQFVNSAIQSDSISLILEDEIDISRGDVILSEEIELVKYSDVNATIIWMDAKPLENNGNYIIKGCFGYANINIRKIANKYNLESFNQISTDKLDINEVGIVDIHCNSRVFIDNYKSDKQFGSFIIIDRLTNLTVGCGMINELIDNDLGKEGKSNLNQEKPFVLWFTGLSGSGKTTTSENLNAELSIRGYHSVLLDGDILRKGLCTDLGYTDSDRSENIRRTAEIAKLILKSGVNVMCSLISPFEKDRQAARRILSDFHFVEVFIDAPIEICEKRDAKGFYSKARVGEIVDFTGISSGYEKPDNPEIVVKTDQLSVDESVSCILDYLVSKNILM